MKREFSVRKWVATLLFDDDEQSLHELDYNFGEDKK